MVLLILDFNTIVYGNFFSMSGIWKPEKIIWRRFTISKLFVLDNGEFLFSVATKTFFFKKIGNLLTVLLLSEFFIMTMLYFSINKIYDHAREYVTGKMPVAIPEFPVFWIFLFWKKKQKKQIALKLTVASGGDSPICSQVINVDIIVIWFVLSRLGV